MQITKLPIDPAHLKWGAGPPTRSQLRLHRQTQLKTKPQTWLPPAHPYPSASQGMSGQPSSSICQTLTCRPSQQQTRQFNALLRATADPPPHTQLTYLINTTERHCPGTACVESTHCTSTYNTSLTPDSDSLVTAATNKRTVPM
jgi:hypothetical protein